MAKLRFARSTNNRRMLSSATNQLKENASNCPGSYCLVHHGFDDKSPAYHKCDLVLCNTHTKLFALDDVGVAEWQASQSSSG